MNKTEYRVQKALGLIYNWDIYVRFQKDSFYTIYQIEAPTKDIALALGYEIIFKQTCKIRKQKSGAFDIFAVNISTDAVRMEGAKVAKKPY